MRTVKEYWLFFLFVIISVIVLLMIFTKNEFVFSFSENTGLYLFSSLIQSNAAIISIFGVFFIFRLQSLLSSISEIYESLLNTNSAVANGAREFRHLSIEEKKAKVDNYKKENDIILEYKKWYKYEKSVIGIKNLIKKPSIIIITLISLQILFLILSNDIHKLGFQYELICFILVTIFQIYVLILLGKTIFIMIKE